jgi:S-methylmethionine-dependent homocysteine/selenocysteine methylase
VEAGASIVGGCCEVGPAHMRYLHDRLADAGYEIAGSLDG